MAPEILFMPRNDSDSNKRSFWMCSKLYVRFQFSWWLLTFKVALCGNV